MRAFPRQPHHFTSPSGRILSPGFHLFFTWLMAALRSTSRVQAEMPRSTVRRGPQLGAGSSNGRISVFGFAHMCAILQHALRSWGRQRCAKHDAQILQILPGKHFLSVVGHSSSFIYLKRSQAALGPAVSSRTHALLLPPDVPLPETATYSWISEFNM